MSNNAQSFDEKAAARILCRHFSCVSDVTQVGDKHIGSYGVTFKGVSAEGYAGEYFARFSRTARLEFNVSQSLSDFLFEKTDLVRVPNHTLVEKDVVVRVFLPGFTLAQIQNYYISGVETAILFERTRSIPKEILGQIEVLIRQTIKLPRHEFFSALTSILSQWPRFLEWRDAICAFLTAPLPGEALRSPFRLMHSVHISPLSNVTPFSMDRSLFSKQVAEIVCTIANVASPSELVEKTFSQLEHVVQACRHFQLYDIHYDNIVLSTDGRLYILDLECSGLGSSDRLLSEPLFAIDDMNRLTELAPIGMVAWAGKGDYRRELSTPDDSVPIGFQGVARVILCGTRTYELIINTCRETIFICAAMMVTSTFSVDEFDRDIQAYDPIWRDFQKLKRWARGMGNPPGNVNTVLFHQLEAFCFQDKECENNQFVDAARSILKCLRSYPLQQESMEHCIFMRIFEFVRFLPFEIQLGRRVRQSDVEDSIKRISADLRTTDLDVLLGMTMDEILNFKIPYHQRKINGVFEFPKRMRRRIERKVILTEKRESKRTEGWLTRALIYARSYYANS